jgi:DNA-binding CsgD family transcriptional regulator/PAS domain-containing protein
MLDAVQAADSVPRFVESLNEIMDEDGLVLVIRVLGDDGTVREQALQVLASGALTIVRDPVEVIIEGRESAMKIASVAGGGELVLRCKKGRKGIVSQPMADLVIKVMRLHRSMVGAEIRGRATAMVLDAVPLGVVLVNSASRVLLTNRAADEILSLADGLVRDSESELRASTPAESDRLRQIIHDVAGVATGEMDRPVGVLRLDRPDSSSSWLLAVIPVRARRRSDTVSEIAALFITGTTEAEPSGIPAQSLERLFSLTPAEARLLIALVDGLGLDEIAEQFEVSKNTLRNQLNQVFRKTGTNKQSELVRMVLSSPAAMLNQRRYLDQA